MVTLQICTAGPRQSSSLTLWFAAQIPQSLHFPSSLPFTSQRTDWLALMLFVKSLGSGMGQRSTADPCWCLLSLSTVPLSGRQSNTSTPHLLFHPGTSPLVFSVPPARSNRSILPCPNHVSLPNIFHTVPSILAETLLSNINADTFHRPFQPHDHQVASSALVTMKRTPAMWGVILFFLEVCEHNSQQHVSV